jgi:hypothetical protein
VNDTGSAGVGVVLILIWFVFVFGGMAVWVWALVDVTRTPEHAFRLSGREKTNWIVVVVLAQIIGGLIWRFSNARKEIKAAAAANPYGPPMMGPPAGWYPDPSGAPGLVWWDGRTWTGHRQDGSQPPPPAS